LAFLDLILEVPVFTLALVMGAALALWIGDAHARRIRFPRGFFWQCALLTTAVGLLGARLYHVLMHLNYYEANPDLILNFAQGGLGWHGGELAGLAMLAGSSLFFRRSFAASPFWKVADALALGLAPALVIGWLSAHISGLYYGAVSDSFGAQELPDEYGVLALRLPVQLASAAWFALLSVWLWYKRHEPVSGRIAAWFLAVGAIGTFLLSFARADPTLMWNNLRVDQYADSAIFLLSVLVLLIRRTEPAFEVRTFELKLASS
jgi:prolipoprotein diacylglyceryltransferase